MVLLLAMKMMSFYPHPLLFYKEPEQSLTLTLAKRNNKCWLLKFPVFMVLGSLMAIRPLPHTCKCCEVFTFIHHFKTVIILESVNKSQKKTQKQNSISDSLVIHSVSFIPYFSPKELDTHFLSRHCFNLNIKPQYFLLPFMIAKCQLLRKKKKTAKKCFLNVFIRFYGLNLSVAN